jgi:hypothetical protein
VQDLAGMLHTPVRMSRRSLVFGSIVHQTCASALGQMNKATFTYTEMRELQSEYCFLLICNSEATLYGESEKTHGAVRIIEND